MKATLLFPDSQATGSFLEDIAIFAARRCRTTKTYTQLWVEVNSSSLAKKSNFLRQVIHEDWAADVLEMIDLIYDLENIPMWLVLELLRHRHIAREFSLEQLSQRAIAASRLEVDEHPNTRLRDLEQAYLRTLLDIAAEEKLTPESMRDFFPQNILVNFVIKGNLRAFHHFWWMRSSPLFQGKGGAHPKFQMLADSMYEQAAYVLPLVTGKIIQA